jgi:UDP-N-acetylmuramyl tripeptide synthase
MGEVAARIADRITVTSDNPRSEDPEAIIDMIFEGIPSDTREATIRVASREAAIQAVILDAEPEDVILIAGKGHETYQELATGRIDFDDREHARAAIAERSRQAPQDSRETT